MQILELNPTAPLATIKFRGKVFLVSEEDFHQMKVRRADRITGGPREQFKTAHGVRDHFAQKGEYLIEGGEICPVEMSHASGGPQSQTAYTLSRLFGDRWFDIEDTNWKAV